MNVGRTIYRQIETDMRRSAMFARLQSEAANRPGSVLVQASRGPIWMSPIEHALHEAMRKDGLDPVPQFCIGGYFVDFAFPDVLVAVEADGAAYHAGDRRQRDAKRDWILRSAGWTVKRFHGSTIYRKAASCSYVVKQEVEGRRAAIARRAWEAELRRRARREALRRPFRKLMGLLRGR